MDDMPPRVIVQPDAENPVTIPDDLLPEWRDEPIARRQEYIRADLAAAALEAKEAEIARILDAFEEALTIPYWGDRQEDHMRLYDIHDAARAALQAKE